MVASTKAPAKTGAVSTSAAWTKEAEPHGGRQPHARRGKETTGRSVSADLRKTKYPLLTDSAGRLMLLRPRQSAGSGDEILTPAAGGRRWASRRLRRLARLTMFGAVRLAAGRDIAAPILTQLSV